VDVLSIGNLALCPSRENRVPGGGIAKRTVSATSGSASVSRPICENCNRIPSQRTASSAIACSQSRDRPLEALRGGASDEEIAGTVRATVWKKWEGHENNTAHFVLPRPKSPSGG
jgi:molybdenum cofactor biosynthesis enzyme MoaA